MDNYSITRTDPLEAPPRRKWWIPILWLLAETCALIVICVLPTGSIAWATWFAVGRSLEQNAAYNVSTTATAQSQTVLADPPQDWKHLDAAFTTPAIWYEGTDTSKRGLSDNVIVKGAYIWKLRADESVLWWRMPDVDRLFSTTNFYVSVDVTRSHGSDSDTRYGLVFRSFSRSYYVFGISNSGMFSIDERAFDHWNTLQDWTYSPTIRDGVINHLAVLGMGSHFWFFINGQFVHELENTANDHGEVGIFHAVHLVGEESTVIFENFTLYVPPD